MESHETDSVTAFDTLYTTNHLQMLKILLPHLQADIQPHIAVYIKLNELLFTLRFSKEQHQHIDSVSDEKEVDMQALISELTPYLNGNEKDMLQKLSSMKENMVKFQQISQMMQMMEGLSDSPESILQGFLSEEQMAMFKMFQEDLA